MRIGSAKRLTGEISPPGDKSISHRSVMLGSIAWGETRIGNFATSADCAATIACFQQLGVSIVRNGREVVINGSGKRGLKAPALPLDCVNSGTTMRLMSGILAGQAFRSILTGDDSLRSRPMKRVIDPLSQMGAAIGSHDGKAPLEIQGGHLNAIKYTLPVASAQIKSCVLLAGLYADGSTTVVEPTPTRDHTERMLRGFGVDVTTRSISEGSEIKVSGESELNSRHITVPGDISSAAFFMVAAACLQGSDLRLENVGLNPTRAAIVDVLRSFGAQIKIERETETSGEPIGDILIAGGLSGSSPHSNVISGKTIANLIDEIPILAVFGTQLDGGLEVRDATELRVKESDRIRSIVENLRRMNADVEEFEDGFRVGRSKLNGATVDSFGDHRIAMAFGVAGLLADGDTQIVGAECADVSFPGFFEVLASIAS